MNLPGRDFSRLMRLARRARRRGDAAGAQGWMRLAERQLALSDRMDALVLRVNDRNLARYPIWRLHNYYSPLLLDLPGPPPKKRRAPPKPAPAHRPKNN